MTSYFTNKRNIDAQWQATQLHLPKNTTPYYRLLTGGHNRRFIYTSPTQTLYWGCIEADYYGVWLLHNPQPLKTADMPIAPIPSSKIEAFKRKSMQQSNKENYFCEYWANYFAQALINSDKHFLHAGRWDIEESKPFEQNSYAQNGINYSIDSRDSAPFYSPKDRLQYIDWDFHMPFPIVYFHRLDEYHGRVKWWRKKVLEGSCPPILTWFQDNLQAHLLIDGHARLLACLLEKVTPTVLTIANVQVKSYAVELSEREKLQRIIEQNHEKMPVDTLNKMLIDCHSPFQTYERTALYSTVIRDMDTRWLREVLEQVEKYPIDDEELQYILN